MATSEKRYGLFHWRGDGMYTAELCMKEYKTSGGAERAARRLYDADSTSDVVDRYFYW